MIRNRGVNRVLLSCSLSTGVGIMTIAFKASGNWPLAELYRNKIIFPGSWLRINDTL